MSFGIIFTVQHMSDEHSILTGFYELVVLNHYRVVYAWYSGVEYEQLLLKWATGPYWWALFGPMDDL